MIPTRASSEQTRKIGRCLVTRAVSSLSLCSGVKPARDALEGALIAEARLEMSTGEKVFGNRRCSPEIICKVMVNTIPNAKNEFAPPRHPRHLSPFCNETIPR